MSVVRTRFVLGDWSQWLTFHDEYVKRGPDYYLTNRAYFDWAFLHNPYNPTPQRYQFSLWRHKGEIVGYIGRIWALMTTGQRYVWHEAGYVRPDMRGRGLGTELYTWAAGEGISGNLMGLKQPQMERVLEKAIGLPTRWEGMERAVLKAEKFAFVNKTYYHPLTHAQAGDGTLISQMDVSKTAAQLWVRSAERYGVSTARTVEWMRWRFIDHPVGTYRVLATDFAIAIVRVEQVPQVSMLRIVDLWGRQAEDVEWVLRLAVEYAQARKVDAVDFMCVGWPDAEAFDALGFERWRGKQMNQLPMLFNPLDVTLREEHVALYGEGVPSDVPWYITRADDGRDRP